MAGRLSVLLVKSYSRSKVYTPAQIRVAYGKLKLNPKYIDVAYAQYLEFDEFAELTDLSEDVYQDSRDLYRRYLPWGGSFSFEPAQMNQYVNPSGSSR